MSNSLSSTPSEHPARCTLCRGDHREYAASSSSVCSTELSTPPYSVSIGFSAIQCARTRGFSSIVQTRTFFNVDRSHVNLIPVAAVVHVYFYSHRYFAIIIIYLITLSIVMYVTVHFHRSYSPFIYLEIRIAVDHPHPP